MRRSPPRQKIWVYNREAAAIPAARRKKSYVDAGPLPSPRRRKTRQLREEPPREGQDRRNRGDSARSKVYIIVMTRRDVFAAAGLLPALLRPLNADNANPRGKRGLGSSTAGFGLR